MCWAHSSVDGTFENSLTQRRLIAVLIVWLCHASQRQTYLRRVQSVIRESERHLRFGGFSISVDTGASLICPIPSGNEPVLSASVSVSISCQRHMGRADPPVTVQQKIIRSLVPK